MGPIQNAAIERPEKVFDVEMVVFGTMTREAVRRTVKVLAQTGAGAKRICRSRYRRIEVCSARQSAPQERCPMLDLFAVDAA